MRRVCMLVYSETLGSRAQVKAALNTIPEVLTWRYDLPNAFYFVTEHEPSRVSEALRTACGGKGRFLLTELVDGQYWGWLPAESWYFIKNKKVKPKG
jgi:hypothetical protein